MKIVCLQENLASGLGIVGRAVASHSSLPVLGNVLLDATGDSAPANTLRLAATDLGIGMNTWVDARIEDPGAVTLPAGLLTDFVKSLPGGEVTLTLDAKRQSVHIQGGGGRYEANIKGVAAEEFPEVSTAESLTRRAEQQAPGTLMRRQLNSGQLARMIGQSAFAAATDESRPILTGVLARIHGDGDQAGALTFAAADGFRLALTTAPAGAWNGNSNDAQSETRSDLIIPARALAEVSRLLDGDEVEMVVPAQGAQVLFHTARADLVTQLIDGSFPDYTQIIPQHHDIRIEADRAALTNAVRVAGLFARDSANIVKLATHQGEVGQDTGTLVVAGESAEMGDNEAEIEINLEGGEIEIAFNGQYLAQALTALGGDRVALELTTNSSPGVIRPLFDGQADDALCVLMPMHATR